MENKNIRPSLNNNMASCSRLKLKLRSVKIASATITNNALLTYIIEKLK